MLLSAKKTGFSLIEVVVAVGIFATAVVVVLAMLPGLSRQAADSADAMTAQRLPDAVRLELERLSASGGFDALRGKSSGHEQSVVRRASVGGIPRRGQAAQPRLPHSRSVCADT